MKRLAIVLLFGALLALSSGCSKGCGGANGGAAQAERARFAVSIFPVYDLVRRVAGPDADVVLILPPGRTEHAFVETATERDAASKARLGVMVGLGLDPWMEKLMAGAAPKARLLKVGDRVPTLDQESATDPYVWLDPERARLIVRAIAEELGRVDAPHTLAYRERATDLDRSLAALDAEVEGRTKALRARGIVTQRGAFQYFAERYGLEVVGVVELSPGAKLREAIAAKRVAAVFRDPALDPGPVEALARDAKVAIGVLDPLGGGPQTDSYEKLIRFDVTELEQHLK